ncbi:MAG: long-chain fatty acid--CoA ligase [Bdellovibrionales bacterium]|nr:long-chain fatty acid--CoA ligase [Bdellovibrionales bacterium]
MHKLIFMIDFVRLLAELEVAGFTAVPSFWHLMMGARVLPLELPKLRYVTVSGGSLEPAAWRWLRQALPHVDLIKTYGQTETFRSLLRHGPPVVDEESFDSLGFPIQGVDLSLKESGELIHRGSGTMIGYYGADPISCDRGVETGDIFVFDPPHGYRFQGRRDDMMKINGHRIYPSQLERVLMEYPAVVEAMVSVVGAEVGVDRLVAVVAVVDGSSVSTVTLQGFVAERVPRGLVPSDVLIQDRLPKTSSGKIDRVQIAQEIQSFLFKKTNV